jgi:hypothetical protein
VNASSGKLAIAGKLGDGTSVTASTLLGAEGDVPLYVRSKTGPATLLSWLQITPSALLSQVAVQGTASWVRLPATGTSVPRNYGQGFEITILNIEGGRYLPPQRGQGVLQLLATDPNASFSVTDGGLTLTEQQLVGRSFAMGVASATSTSQVLALPKVGTPENPANLKLAINPTTGLLTGSFQLRDVDPLLPLAKPHVRTVSVQGLVLPFRNEVQGFYLAPEPLGPNPSLIRSGSALIGAVDPD